jgi:hypothetical protein
MRAAHRTGGGSGARDRAEATREEVHGGGMPGGHLQGVEGYHGEHRAVFSFVVCTQVT